MLGQDVAKKKKKKWDEKKGKVGGGRLMRFKMSVKTKTEEEKTDLPPA